MRKDSIPMTLLSMCFLGVLLAKQNKLMNFQSTISREIQCAIILICTFIIPWTATTVDQLKSCLCRSVGWSSMFQISPSQVAYIHLRIVLTILILPIPMHIFIFKINSWLTISSVGKIVLYKLGITDMISISVELG